MYLKNQFHMKEGSGPTSYSQNSHLQRNVADMVKHITLHTLQQLYTELSPETITIADLGCSSGQNSLSTIKSMVEMINKVSDRSPEFYIHLNDLPTNDFNSVFRNLSEFHQQFSDQKNGVSSSVFVSGCPGSFYERLFPKNSLHFVYSANSLHWLSKVPPGIYDENGESMNRGKIYISEKSGVGVSLAYLNQFREDFSLFHRLRCKEMVSRGRMVLILLGRVGSDPVDRDNSVLWELLSEALASLVAQGKVDEEKFKTYHTHFYAASKEEIEEEVRKDGSFKIEQFEMFQSDRKANGSVLAMAIRAIQESRLRQHFGIEEDEVFDTLFHIYAKLLDVEIAKQEIKPFSFLIVLKKFFNGLIPEEPGPAESDQAKVHHV